RRHRRVSRDWSSDVCSSDLVWRQIEADLDQAILLLKEETGYVDGERTQVNLYAAMALQARVCLYRKNWVKAEELSSMVIAQSGRSEERRVGKEARPSRERD